MHIWRSADLPVIGFSSREALINTDRSRGTYQWIWWVRRRSLDLLVHHFYLDWYWGGPWIYFHTNFLSRLVKRRFLDLLTFFYLDWYWWGPWINFYTFFYLDWFWGGPWVYFYTLFLSRLVLRRSLDFLLHYFSISTGTEEVPGFTFTLFFISASTLDLLLHFFLSRLVLRRSLELLLHFFSISAGTEAGPGFSFTLFFYLDWYWWGPWIYFYTIFLSRLVLRRSLDLLLHYFSISAGTEEVPGFTFTLFFFLDWYWGGPWIYFHTIFLSRVVLHCSCNIHTATD